MSGVKEKNYTIDDYLFDLSQEYGRDDLHRTSVTLDMDRVSREDFEYLLEEVSGRGADDFTFKIVPRGNEALETLAEYTREATESNDYGFDQYAIFPEEGVEEIEGDRGSPYDKVVFKRIGGELGILCADEKITEL